MRSPRSRTRRQPGRHLPRERVEVGHAQRDGRMDASRVDPRIPMRHDVSQANGARQCVLRPLGDHTVIRDSSEGIGEGTGRRPTFVGDYVTRNVSTRLHRQHEIERDQVERIPVRRELGRGWSCVSSRSSHTVRKLGELRSHELTVDQGSLAQPPASATRSACVRTKDGRSRASTARASGTALRSLGFARKRRCRLERSSPAAEWAHARGRRHQPPARSRATGDPRGRRRRHLRESPRRGQTSAEPHHEQLTQRRWPARVPPSPWQQREQHP